MQCSGGTPSLVVAMLTILVIASLPLRGEATGTSPIAAPQVFADPGHGLPASTPAPTDNISYSSSVDGFPLSYLEWLPTGFSASASYPVAVFLHGVGASSAATRGGVGGIVDISSPLVNNASSFGFILVSLNTRTSNGFYVNTPCGGPQEQDVLDAIAHESTLRHVTGVYLIGFSMGSLGSFSIAGHHPGLISGIATAGSISDIYQTIEFDRQTHSEPAGLYDAMCGAYPGPTNASVDRVWTYLSVLRFQPQNFSGIPLFVTGGGDDTRAPNNFLRWGYANVNNTFVNATCAVAADEGEPANCTVPIAQLAQAHPGSYRWLDLYEATGTHSAAQLPAAAVFSFFLSQTPGGYFASTFPGGALTPIVPSTTPPTQGSHPSAMSSVWLWLVIAAVAVVAILAVVVLARRRS